MTRSAMLLLMLQRAVTVRGSRALVVLMALTLSATVGSTLFNIFRGVDAKLHHEFRSFGANVAVLANNGNAVPLAELRSALPISASAVPYAYAIVKDPVGRPVVVVGTDLTSARKMNPGWKVEGSTHDPEAAMIGQRVARSLGSDHLMLTFGGRTHAISTANLVATGGPEDSRIFLPLHVFSAWTQVPATVAELSIPGSAPEVEAVMGRLKDLFPHLEIRPIRQLIEAQTHVLDSTKAIFFAAGIMITGLVVLCVLSALTSAVLERRRDFALMKALGCSQRIVAAVFLGEAGALAILASVLGFVLGAIISNMIGRISFHAPLSARFEALPLVLVVTMLVALTGALLPLMRLRRILPAVMLKGE
jgi:putative ABC transport system permease protein